MLFEVDNIELSFNGKLLLNGVYLKAEKGKITGILGANGSGKSSLLNIIFGSLIPRHKLIRIDNTPFLKPLFTYKGKVKHLPQQPFIPDHLKLKTVFQLFKVDWQEFIEKFSPFSNYRDSKINELSGGERRMVETYLIVKSEADIILLDEPFTHLAPVYIENLILLLKEEARHKAIIITDHLYHHIIDIANDIYFINNGCSRLIKEPKDLEDLNYLNTGTI